MLKEEGTTTSDNLRFLKMDFEKFKLDPSSSLFGPNCEFTSKAQSSAMSDSNWSNNSSSAKDDFPWTVSPFSDEEIIIAMKRDSEYEAEELKRDLFSEWFKSEDGKSSLLGAIKRIEDGFLLLELAIIDLECAQEIPNKVKFNPHIINCIQQCMEKCLKATFCVRFISQASWMLLHGLDLLASFCYFDKEKDIIDIACKTEMVGWVPDYIDKKSKLPIVLSVRARYPRWECPGLKHRLTPQVLFADVNLNELFSDAEKLVNFAHRALINAYFNFLIQYAELFMYQKDCKVIIDSCAKIENVYYKYFV